MSVLSEREEHICVESFYLFHSVYNSECELKTNLEWSCKMRDIVIGFLYSVFTEATSTSSMHCLPLSRSNPENLRVGHLWDLSLRRRPFHTTWPLCPVKVLQSLTISEGQVSVSKGSGRPSPSQSAFPVLMQLLECWGTSGFLIGLCCPVGHLCSWYSRVVLHHCSFWQL